MENIEKDSENTSNQVTFHNKINSGFRQIHVDGALGGLTPKGYLNLNFYSERFPIPKASTYSANENGDFINKIDSSASKDGIIREYEFGIYLDFETARSLRDLINSKLIEFDEIVNKSKDVNTSK